MSAPDRIRLVDASIRIDWMPTTGRELHVAPEAAEREAIARQLELTSLDALDVTLNAVRFRGGIRVTGRLTAKITQPSVVTLEPVQQDIAEPIDRVFLPGGEKPYAGTAGAEVFVDLEGEDLPDHFEGPEADLSDLIVETLALAVDPYPRAKGESVDDLGLAPGTAEDHPFAALKTLKSKDE